jgi:hypothetical protein
MEDTFKISDEIKIKIVHELIEPFYVNDIRSIIKNKKCWKLSGQVFEAVSKILVAIGGIVSFSSGYFNDPVLSFFAGSISTLSLATLQFASFAYVENKRQGQDLNILLKKLNIDVVPVLEKRYDSVDMSLHRRGSKSTVDSDTLLPPPQILPPRLGSIDEGLVVSEFVQPPQPTGGEETKATSI